MKNILKYISVAGALTALLLASCKDEVLVPVEDNKKADSISTAIQTAQGGLVTLNTEMGTISLSNKKLKDSIANLPATYATTKVQYTISVISAASAWWTNSTSSPSVQRITGVNGATVKLTQNAATITQTTENGIVVFQGLNPGTVFVSVSAPDHTTVDFTANLGIGEETGDVRNAGSQIFLFPNGASNGATVTGMAHANTSTLNDTLGRVNNVVGDPKKGTYTAAPNNFGDASNYMQSNFTYRNPNSPIANSNSTSTYSQEISWEKGGQNMKVFAYPSLRLISSLPNNLDSEDPGYITEITYKDIVRSGTIGENGAFTISGIPVSNFSGTQMWEARISDQIAFPSGVKNTVEFRVAGFWADHTRLTEKYGVHQFEEEATSTPQTFKIWNNATGMKTDYAARTIKHQAFYWPLFVHSGNDGDQSPSWSTNQTFVSHDMDLKPGDNKTLTILFWPVADQLQTNND